MDISELFDLIDESQISLAIFACGLILGVVVVLLLYLLDELTSYIKFPELKRKFRYSSKIKQVCNNFCKSVDGNKVSCEKCSYAHICDCLVSAALELEDKNL